MEICPNKTELIIFWNSKKNKLIFY